MKKVLSLFLCVILILCLPACTYNPPDGYTEEHHTYEEILKFAKGIDPNATVSKEYTDTTIDAWNRKFREYPAIINGIECHVSSVGDMVWNEGFLAGEFARQYYVIDTDYDYLMLKQIVADNQPQWTMRNDDISTRYNWNNIVSVYITPSKSEQLSDEELNIVWKQAKEIYTAYNNLPIRKSILFCLPAPGKSFNYNGEGKEFVRRNAYVYIEEFSENDKLKLINRYHEAWALLESDLPIYDVTTAE